MTASLYQTAWSATAESSAALCEVIAGTCLRNQGQTTFFLAPSQEEKRGLSLISLLSPSRSCAPHHFEDVRRKLMGIELDVVPRPGPRIAPAREEIMDLEGLVRRDVELWQVE